MVGVGTLFAAPDSAQRPSTGDVCSHMPEIELLAAVGTLLSNELELSGTLGCLTMLMLTNFRMTLIL